MGIEELCKRYDYHRMLMGLLSNMDEAAKIPVPVVMKECYEVYINSPYGVYIDAVLQKGGWYLARRGSVLSIGSSVQKFQLL